MTEIDGNKIKGRRMFAILCKIPVGVEVTILNRDPFQINRICLAAKGAGIKFISTGPRTIRRVK